MGKRFDMPWLGGGEIPWIGGQNILGKGVKIP